MRLLNVKLYEIPKLIGNFNKILDTELFVETAYDLAQLIQNITKDISLKSNPSKRGQVYMISVYDVDDIPMIQKHYTFRIDKNGNFDIYNYYGIGAR